MANDITSYDTKVQTTSPLSLTELRVTGEFLHHLEAELGPPGLTVLVDRGMPNPLRGEGGQIEYVVYHPGIRDSVPVRYSYESVYARHAEDIHSYLREES